MKKKKWAYAIVILIAIIAFCFLGYSIFKNYKNKSLANDLYSYLGNNDLEKCGGLLLYSNDTVSYKNLENSNRICQAYSIISDEEIETIKLEKDKKGNTCSLNDSIKFATDNYEGKECTVVKVSAEKVSEKYYQIYGKDLDSNTDFTFDNKTACFYDNKNYYCGLSETFTYTLGSEPTTYRSIKKVVRKDNKVIIYDYFLKTFNDECYSDFTTEEKNDKCSQNLNNQKDIKYSFIKKYGTLYEHTFIKIGENYHWKQSTPVK